MAHKPTIYDQFTNSLGQVIKFAEHPIHGDEADIIALCEELQLAEYTGFWELDDMLADHKEYEPKFIDGKLFIGNFQH